MTHIYDSNCELQGSLHLPVSLPERPARVLNLATNSEDIVAASQASRRSVGSDAEWAPMVHKAGCHKMQLNVVILIDYSQFKVPAKC